MQTQTRQLQTLKGRYQKLAQKLAGIEYIVRGSIISSLTRCGTPGCRCTADPPQLHGPYWTWTRSQDGKTITRRLTPQQAKLYQQWNANARRFDRIVAEMESIARQAAELLAPKARSR